MLREGGVGNIGSPMIFVLRGESRLLWQSVAFSEVVNLHDPSDTSLAQ